MFDLKGRLRSVLRRAGKGEEKVACVFGATSAASHQAVLHLRTGAPEVPIWLFTTVEPLAETQALCERVYRNESASALVAEAQSRCWSRWVAISVATWTGERGAWILKVAPLLIPHFRVLILNRDGGFFAATPANIFVHCMRAAGDQAKLWWANIREAIHEAYVRLRAWADSALVRVPAVSRCLKRLARATGLRG